MKAIFDNPFRVLGIPVNAGAKDLAANKGRMKLLDIGKEVSFPLDLTIIMSPITRSKESVSVAERDINLPQDKIRHALFWIAKPTDTIGKFGYERLLSGNIDDAIEKLEKSNSWEAQLCVATLLLTKANFQGALSAINNVIELHISDFLKTIAGETYVTDTDSLRHEYLSVLSSELDITDLYLKLAGTQVPNKIIEDLRNMAVESPIAVIEKEITDAKAVDTKSISAQLKAGKDLKANTSTSLNQLKKIVGVNDLRYSRVVDKLANQILQCSINYFNAHKEETRVIINNALALGEYAQSIAVGNIAREHIKHNVDILRRKIENLPPAGVETEVYAILSALKSFVDKPDMISHAVTLIDDTKCHLNSIKRKLGITDYYLKLSTQVVHNALHNIIEEVNSSQTFTTDPVMLRIIFQPVVEKAWDCMRSLDSFDMEDDFRKNRYLPNRNTLRKMYDDIHTPQPTSTPSSSSGGCYIATMVYGDYDHPQVMVLRGFRDDVLQQCVLGRAFIRFYYKHSPAWVERLKDKKGINNFIRKILDRFIKIYNHEK